MSPSASASMCCRRNLHGNERQKYLDKGQRTKVAGTLTLTRDKAYAKTFTVHWRSAGDGAITICPSQYRCASVSQGGHMRNPGKQLRQAVFEGLIWTVGTAIVLWLFAP